MKAIICVILCMVLLGCATVAPAEDYPILAVPPMVALEDIRPTKSGGMWIYTSDEYIRLVVQIQEILGELRACRRILLDYNEWVRLQRDE